MSYINTYISICARDRPERGCKKHITMAYGNWEKNRNLMCQIDEKGHPGIY